MKVAYKHLVNFIPSRPSIDDISEKLFQLGHEHEINKGIFDMELTPNRGDCLSINGLLRDLAVFYDVTPSEEIYVDEIKIFKLDFINNAPNACPHISFLKIDIEGEIKPYKGLLKDYFDDLEINKNNFLLTYQITFRMKPDNQPIVMTHKKLRTHFLLKLLKKSMNLKLCSIKE